MMSRVFSLFLIIVFISCGVEDTPKKINIKATYTSADVKRLKNFENHPLMFYNVENLFDTINDPAINDVEFTPKGSKEWNSKRYNDKLMKLAQVLTAVNDKNPMFIGLAEIESRAVVKDLIQTERLSETKYGIAHYDSPDRRGIDVALAFDTDRFLLIQSEAIPVRLKNDKKFKTRDILYVKGLLKDGIPLHLFVNHWSSRYGGQKESEHKRVQAAKILKSKADSILAIDSDANIIFMGDFNDYPTNKSITQVLKAASSAESKSSDFINLLAPQHSEGKGTHNYKGKWGALDQIIISKGLQNGKSVDIKEHKAFILKKDFLLYEHKSGDKTPSRTYGGPNYYGGYSDHLAVYTFLERVEN